MDFFDNAGKAACFLPDGKTLYLWDGKPVAYLREDRVFGFSGRFLGWLERGWLHDRSNHPTLFSANATDGPLRPMKQARPLKGLIKAPPIPSPPQPPPMRPVKSKRWSEICGADYFTQ